jgi:hypothetical protein
VKRSGFLLEPPARGSTKAQYANTPKD